MKPYPLLDEPWVAQFALFHWVEAVSTPPELELMARPKNYGASAWLLLWCLRGE